ncbi:hypothetical protein GDO81_029883 [Engystomops pustulosus]|uniref:Uncharacterized protein n=1 Tax=Engystomops pustulosus TaxID=76066 RepID=A0AAV6YC62_ENGPU|nr:hypothetical protein GDO81_029883 [Engystomops pustulosus]
MSVETRYGGTAVCPAEHHSVTLCYTTQLSISGPWWTFLRVLQLEGVQSCCDGMEGGLWGSWMGSSLPRSQNYDYYRYVRSAVFLCHLGL